MSSPEVAPQPRAGSARAPIPVSRAKDEVPLPHPAEDLSADDDLLSWILVDQLGCMPNSRLGVHPQENKFVGPAFKTDDVLTIVKEVRPAALPADTRPRSRGTSKPPCPSC